MGSARPDPINLAYQELGSVFARLIAMWIERLQASLLAERLSQFAAVVLLGPRQVGKTTLARQLGAQLDAVYLDLESPSDQARLSDPELYLQRQRGRLVILDEVQRVPELFGLLRGLIDANRLAGHRTGQFLLLGSASMDLLRQSSESLAGRIACLELNGLNVLEVGEPALDQLWNRGGFPDSFQAASDSQSSLWRAQFLRTYLERDIPQLGPRIPAETLRRFWTMLAHSQGGLLNAASLGRSLGVDGKTIRHYLDLLVDLLLVRQLQPLLANPGKRLVKSPRIYVRDSGLVHTLLGLDNLNLVLGHPVAGSSWEGFVIETLLSLLPERAQGWFYRTAAGAEIDLVIEWPNGNRWAVEIKRSSTPRLSRGFHQARADLLPDRCFVVAPIQSSYPLTEGVEVISLPELARVLQAQRS
ncbi:MAG: ATP-binding protein [Cyanobacteria bacterium]|nr:ATP-binding protein [Cyanobacteria bacterium bin.275]